MAALRQDRGRLSDALDTSRLGALDAETKRLAAEGNSQELQEELQTLRLNHKAEALEWGALRPLVHEYTPPRSSLFLASLRPRAHACAYQRYSRHPCSSN